MKKILFVEGMSCGHCKMHVENALKEVPGVKSAVVSLEEKTAVVEADENVDGKVLKDAVEEAGYTVTGIE